MNIRIRQIKKARRMIETSKARNKAMATAFASHVKEMVSPQYDTCFTAVTNAFLDLGRAADCACKAIVNLVPNLYV